MKQIYFLLVAILVTTFSFAQGSEDFTNSNATSSYADGNFVGNNGVTWTYVASRDANNDANGSGIALPALMLRRVANGSKVTSSPVAGGIADFSVKLYKGFTGGGNRQVELYVNGVLKGTSTPFDDLAEHIFTVAGINVGGDVTIELVNVTTKQVIVDDITWTAYAGAAVPTLAINSPAMNEVMPSGDVTVNYAISNFNVAAPGNGGDGHFHWQLDGGASTPEFTNTGTLALTGLAAGSHTLFMDLRDDSHQSLTPPVEATVTFTVQAYTQVATIADLRAGVIGNNYELTGEALINYAQGFRSQKWIQDATAGILIDDQSGNITAGARGDGLSGIKGRLGEYQGMMQFIPLVDATLVSPSTVTITPQVVTLADLAAMSENYEAKLIKVEGVTLAGGGNFINGTIYPMSQGADAFDFRANFYNVDYTGTAVPTNPRDIVGLVAQNASGYTFAARDLADFQYVAAVGENTIAGFAMYPNPVNGDVLTINTLQNAEKNIQIFNILGKQVLAKTITGNTVNVANLNAGIYLIKVEEAGSFITRKLVIK